MKYLWMIVFAALFSVPVSAQTLLRNSSEVDRAVPDTAIKKIRPQKFGKNLKVKYRNGNKEMIPMDSLWGFVDRKGKVFRLYEHQPYQIHKEEDYITYLVITNNPQPVLRRLWFFSKNRDSEIVNRKRKLKTI